MANYVKLNESSADDLLNIMKSQPDWFLYDLMKACKFHPGDTGLVLASLVDRGRVTKRWQEMPDGQPRRRVYSAVNQ